MRPRSVLSTAALLLVAVTGCVSSTDSLGEAPEVEVTDYGTRWREEKFVAEAEYTIRNPYSDPVEFRVGFSFTSDGSDTLEWATRTVDAGTTVTGTVFVPWEKHLPSPRVEVESVREERRS